MLSFALRRDLTVVCTATWVKLFLDLHSNFLAMILPFLPGPLSQNEEAARVWLWCLQTVVFKLSCFCWPELDNSDVIRGGFEIEHFINWTVNSFWAETSFLCVALTQGLAYLAFHESVNIKCTFSGFCFSLQIHDTALCSLISLEKALEKWIKYLLNLWNSNIRKWEIQ